MDASGQDVDTHYPSLVKIPVDKDKEVEQVLFFPEGQAPQSLAFERVGDVVIFTAPHFTHYAIEPSQVDQLAPTTSTQADHQEEEHKDMVDQEIHQLLSAHQGVNLQPTVQQETKDASRESQSEHLPNTASLEASFAAEAVLLAALGGFLLAGKKKEE